MSLAAGSGVSRRHMSILQDAIAGAKEKVREAEERRHRQKQLAKLRAQQEKNMQEAEEADLAAEERKEAREAREAAESDGEPDDGSNSRRRPVGEEKEGDSADADADADAAQDEEAEEEEMDFMQRKILQDRIRQDQEELDRLEAEEAEWEERRRLEYEAKLKEKGERRSLQQMWDDLGDDEFKSAHEKVLKPLEARRDALNAAVAERQAEHDKREAIIDDLDAKQEERLKPWDEQFLEWWKTSPLSKYELLERALVRVFPVIAPPPAPQAAPQETADTQEEDATAAASGKEEAAPGESQPESAEAVASDSSEAAHVPGGGTSVVKREATEFEKAWSQVTGSVTDSAAFRTVLGFRSSLEDSDSPIVQSGIERLASMKGSVGRMWEETDEAAVLRKIQSLQPGFDRVYFIEHYLKEELVPELVHALCTDDTEVLEAECAPMLVNALKTGFEQRRQMGWFNHSELLDVRMVELQDAALFDDDEPALVIHFAVHQTNCFKDNKGTIVQGSEDQVLQVHYVLAMQLTEDRTGWYIRELNVAAMLDTF